MIVNAPAKEYPVIFTEEEEISIMSCVATLENICKVMKGYNCENFELGNPDDPIVIDEEEILNIKTTLENILDIRIMF